MVCQTRKIGLAWLKFVTVLSVLVPNTGLRANPLPSGFYEYTPDEVSNVIAKVGPAGFEPYEITRNGKGNKVIFYGKSNDRTIAIIIRDTGEKVTKTLGSELSLLDVNENEIEFKQERDGVNQYMLSIHGFSIRGVKEYDVDNDCRFLIVHRANDIELRQVSNPGKLLTTVSRGWFGSKVFSNERAVFICGRVSDGKTQAAIECEWYSMKEGRLESHRSFVIKRGYSGSSPFYIEDMNIDAEKILVVDSMDLPIEPILYLYDIKKDNLERIHTHSDFVLFLDSDMVNWLKK
jgi:hypothetical protein